MKHHIIALPILLAACTLMQAADQERIAYFDCGFENGLPADATLYDEDALPLHFTMTQRGFAATDSWRVMREEGTENYYAASASTFKDAPADAAASDWLVFAPVWIRGGDACLKWKSRSINEQSSRGSKYEVYVSTAGPTPAEIRSSQPMATITEDELDDWASHEIDLSAYAGKRVYIAFVNVTANGEILGIDDVEVTGLKGVADIRLTPGSYALGTEQHYTIGGVLTACDPTQPVKSFEASCLLNGETYNVAFTDLNLQDGESMEFTFPLTVSGEFGESASYTVNARVNDIEFDPMPQTTTMLAFFPTRNVVIEEVTGMWCQYCPMGIVAFDIMQEKYPDNFIGIAVHMGAQQDEMALDDYANQDTFPGGAPSGWIDRKVYSVNPMVPARIDTHRTYTTLMGGFETLFLERLEELPMAEIKLTSALELNSDGTFTVSTASRFPINMTEADLRVAIVLTEDHVWKEGYYQNNRFSGGSETLYGWESLPARIMSDMEFNHVARAIYDDYNGIPSSLPTEIKAGETYEYTVDLPYPTSILNPDNVKVTAMIIDHSTGEILNAAQCSLDPSAVDEITAPALPVKQTLINGRITVTSADGLPIDLTLHTAAGQRVAATSGHTTATLSAPATSGIYLLTIRTPEGLTTRKLRL